MFLNLFSKLHCIQRKKGEIEESQEEKEETRNLESFSSLCPMFIQDRTRRKKQIKIVRTKTHSYKKREKKNKQTIKTAK